jgi:hypothetical protein
MLTRPAKRSPYSFALTVVTVVALSSACNGTERSPSAGPVAPVPVTFPYPSFTLRGTVTDSTSGRPIRYVQVRVSDHPVEMRATPSDEAGRYETSGLPVSATPNWIQAAVDGYLQQCAVPVAMDGSITTLNIQLTRKTDLSPTSPPYTPPLGSRTVTGRVFANIAGVRTPVADAGVVYVLSFDYLAAWTNTDASGRFLLCGLPTTQLELAASTTQANAEYLMVESGGDTAVDIELR